MDECDKRNRAATARFGEKGKWDLKDGQARKKQKEKTTSVQTGGHEGKKQSREKGIKTKNKVL